MSHFRSIHSQSQKLLVRPPSLHMVGNRPHGGLDP